MKNTTLLALLALTSLTASAASDLELPGQRWLGAANGYVCANDTTKVITTPASLESIGLAFETVTTDITLDNGLLKGTFVENGVTCRYSALILANNATNAVTLIDSRAYAADETATCEAGKALLDSNLLATSYVWKERPRPAHLTIFFNSENAEALCGVGETQVGVDFLLTGRI